MMEPVKSSTLMWLWITLILVVLAGGGFFGWYYLAGPGKAETKTTPAATTPTAATTTDTTTTADWLTYTNSIYGYSIKYPKELSYKEEDGTKYMHFYTAAEAATLAECQKREATECNPGGEIYIATDQTLGTTNADDITKTIKEIVDNRVSRNTASGTPTLTTLGGQPAYEVLSEGMLTSYNIVSLRNSHVYDLTILCGEGATTLTACKSGITPTQQQMIDSFKYL